jgi:hypothetical protein
MLEIRHSNSVHFFIIYVLAQQPQGQLQRQHINTRQIQKYSQQNKSHTQEVIKKITPKNNSVNNIRPVKETFVKWNTFSV